MSKFDVGWGFAPDSTGGAHSAVPDFLAAFKGREERGEKSGWRGNEGKGGRERRGEEGEGNERKE